MPQDLPQVPATRPDQAELLAQDTKQPQAAATAALEELARLLTDRVSEEPHMAQLAALDTQLAQLSEVQEAVLLQATELEYREA